MLIVVAVGLAIIFRNQVNTIIGTVGKRVQEAVTQLATGTITNTIDGAK